jgi:hypothetical protein
MSSWNISCYHLSRNFLLSRVGSCRFTNRIRGCRRFLILDNQGHMHICPSWVSSGESDTGTPPPLISFAPLSIIPNCCLRLTHLPQMLYSVFITQRLCFPRLRLCLLFRWRHRSPEWCRSQLRCLEFLGLDKILTEITISKDAFSIAQFVATLPKKAEGRGFDSRLGRWDFYWLNPSGLTMAVGWTQVLREMRTWCISLGVKAAGA